MSSDAPSANQIAFAEKIADALGVPLPDACRDDWRKCREFIDKNRSALPSGDGGTPLPPKEKQLAFAEKIAAAMGIPLSDECRSDYKKCGEFIDKNKSALPPGGEGSGGASYPPKERQLAYAESIASRLGVELPADVRADWKKCSAWIDANKSK